MTQPPAKKRGHWPRGKPRNPPAPRGVVPALRRAVEKRGLRATARLLGCCTKSIHRWVDGRWPAREFVPLILRLESLK